MDMAQYTEMFIDESREHLQNLNSKMLELEKSPSDIEVVQDIFRSAHTLKGMAATMGYDNLASLTHKMENALDLIRNNKLHVDEAIIDVLFQSVDYLEDMITSIQHGEKDVINIQQISNLLDQLEHGEEPISEQKNKEQLDDSLMQVIEEGHKQGMNCYNTKVFLEKNCILPAARAYMVFQLLEERAEIIKSIPSVDELETGDFDSSFELVILTTEEKDLLQAKILSVSEIEEVIIHELEANEKNLQPSNMSGTTKKAISKDKKDLKSKQASKYIRVGTDKLDELMNLFEELIIDRGRLEKVSEDINHVGLTETVEHITRITSDLQETILKMRLVPIEQIFNRFPRMVRSLAKELDKQIELEIKGEDTELDRTVIEEIGDPLVHLIRNSIDHGIETSSDRIASSKNEVGSIRLAAYYSGNQVIIEIEDDGAGINREKVVEKALENGLIGENDSSKLTDQEVYNLLFKSGFSTAETISDISGRGVGLDAVKNKIESLGGSISVDSSVGKGSLFKIHLPLTLSIISSLLVEIDDERYAIPLTSIVETSIINHDDIIVIHNQQTINYRGKIVPIIFLDELFDIRNSHRESPIYSIVMIKKGERIAALVVDAFIGQHEIVIKPLGDYLQQVFAISGATILGDGKVALVLDCNALVL